MYQPLSPTSSNLLLLESNVAFPVCMLRPASSGYLRTVGAPKREHAVVHSAYCRLHASVVLSITAVVVTIVLT